MNFIIRVTKANQPTLGFEFSSAKNRSDWLTKNGFFESGGVFRHLDGRIAGLHTVEQHDKLHKICTLPARKTKSVWETLLCIK